MKNVALTLVVVALGPAGCGGGTLGNNSGNGSSGMIGPAGAAGGAVGGAGGVSGRGGTWWDGVGGTFVAPCPAPPPPVCGSLCGNGGIDECTSPPTPGCTVAIWREQCDGDDFGNDSCQAQGFGSGKLSCNSDCTQGPTNCSPCVPQDSLVASCAPGPALPQYFGNHSLAATDTEVALVLLQYDDLVGTASLLFKRLSSDLSVLSTTTLDDVGLPGVEQESIYGTAVAPLPSDGWIVAVCGRPNIYFHALDAAGRPRGRVVVSQSAAGFACAEQVPVLAARPNGGPLMVWQEDAGVMMSVIAADGLSATPPRSILDGLTSNNATAAWIGNEFVVAVPVDVDPLDAEMALRLLRVAPDGVPLLVGDFLAGEFGVFARMASGADARDVRVVYQAVPPFTTDYGMRWWRRDPTGPSRSTSIGSPLGDLYTPASAVAFGDDTVILASRGYGVGAGIARVASDGRVVSAYRDVFRDPYSYGGAMMVRRGPEIVVSFVSPGRLHLARLTP